MENNTVLWITIAAYIICLVVIGIVEGRKAKSMESPGNSGMITKPVSTNTTKNKMT